jgi:hypothetical protein
VPSPSAGGPVVAKATLGGGVKKSKKGIKAANAAATTASSSDPTATVASDPTATVVPVNLVVKNTNWVMCNNKDCEKWRKLPAYVDADSLPEEWFCCDNIWDLLHNSCDHEEEL